MTDQPGKAQSRLVENATDLRSHTIERASSPAEPARSTSPRVPLGSPIVPLGEAEFRAAYEAHFDYVWHSLRRLGVAERDLEDVCHDVFVAFYRSGEYDPSRPLKPWLFGIAFRVASDWRRRAHNRLEIPTAPEGQNVPDAAVPADERVSQRERRRIVEEALDALDLDRRAVFVMHEIDGHAMPEIAAALGVPLNTCYSRLRLARAEFAAAVKRRRRGRAERETP